MNNFHINKHGNPAICKATKGNCPLGDSRVHFENIELAQNYIDNSGKLKHGLLPDVTKANIDLNALSEDWRQKFISHDTFDEFASEHARTLIKDELITGPKNDYYEATERAWKAIHYKNSALNLNKLSDEEMINVVKNNIATSVVNGWFREYNSDYKPKIENAIITKPELRNASLNIAHRVYQETTGNQVDFDEFMDSEVEVYRGGNFNYVDSDVFVSYSFDRKIAEDFAKKTKGSEVVSRKVKIRDTLGSLQTTGEAEIMIKR